jgi:hypothetical protein
MLKCNTGNHTQHRNIMTRNRIFMFLVFPPFPSFRAPWEMGNKTLNFWPCALCCNEWQHYELQNCMWLRNGMRSKDKTCHIPNLFMICLRYFTSIIFLLGRIVYWNGTFWLFKQDSISISFEVFMAVVDYLMVLLFFWKIGQQNWGEEVFSYYISIFY